MTTLNPTESRDEAIARLQVELAAERARADAAEEQLVKVHVAVRAYKQKQEQMAYARKAREARALAAQAAAFESAQAAELQAAREATPTDAHHAVAETLASGIGSPTGSALAEAWEDPDPSLDERLDKYLESSFEPDRSRTWMLEE